MACIHKLRERLKQNCPGSCCGDHKPIPSSDDDVREEKKSSVWMTSFNTTNAIIGSGILGIPFALKEAGIGMGIILLIITGVLSAYTHNLLVQAGEMSTNVRPTYQNVMTEAFGRPGFIIVTAMQFLYPFIAMISYNVIIGDTMTKIIIRLSKGHLEDTFFGHRQVIVSCTTLLVTLPLSLYRDIAKLSKYAAVSAILVFTFTILMAIRLGTLHLPPTDDAYTFANISITRAIGVLAFAYMSHHVTFLLYESMEVTNSTNWSRVVNRALSYAGSMMLLTGVLGYVTFTGNTQGDLLENYCQNDDLMNVGRFFFTITVMTTYALECFAARETLEQAIFPGAQPSPLRRHVIVTMMLVFITTGLSFLTDCLGVFLEINGVLSAVPMAFIFPPLLVLKLQSKPLCTIMNLPLGLTLLFGLFSSGIGLAVALMEIINGVECSHGLNPEFCIVNVTNIDFNLTALSSIVNATDNINFSSTLS